MIFFTFGIIVILYSNIPDYYNIFYVQGQQQPSLIMDIKITSTTESQQVAVGDYTISGTSTDNSSTDCTVYTDRNNLKPFQKAVATGPGGPNDYSTWNFTYTDKYHIITIGTNILTATLSCFNDKGGTDNITKSYSVNVIGIAKPSDSSSSSSNRDTTGSSSSSNRDTTGSSSGRYGERVTGTQ